MNKGKARERLRAVVLAALMVGSVFAGTVALSGTAAASISGVNPTGVGGDGVSDIAGDQTSVQQNVTFNVTTDGASDNVKLNLSSFTSSGASYVSGSYEAKLLVNDSDFSLISDRFETSNNTAILEIGNTSGVTPTEATSGRISVNVSFDTTGVAPGTYSHDITDSSDTSQATVSFDVTQPIPAGDFTNVTKGDRNQTFFSAIQVNVPDNSTSTAKVYINISSLENNGVDVDSVTAPDGSFPLVTSGPATYNASGSTFTQNGDANVLELEFINVPENGSFAIDNTGQPLIGEFDSSQANTVTRPNFLYHYVAASSGTTSDSRYDASGGSQPSKGINFQAGTYEISPASAGGNAGLVNESGGSTTSFDTVGDTITVFVKNSSLPNPGAATVTATHNYAVDGSTVTRTLTPNETGSGYLTTTFPAAKDGDTSITIDVNGSEFDTITYTTDNYFVDVTDEVLHGATQDITGEIFDYYDPDDGDTVVPGGSGTSLEDDTNVDYNVTDTDLNNIGSGDTGSGTFQDTRTFDDTITFSNPQTSRTNDLDYPSDAGTAPNYSVFVKRDPGDSGVTPNISDNNGSDTIDVRVDLSVSPTTTDYNATVDLSGSVLDGLGNGLEDYLLGVRDPTRVNDSAFADPKVKNTTTAGNGDFSQTIQFNDAGDWQFGTNQGNGSAVDEFIEYATIEVGPEDAQVSIASDGNNLRTFEETYTVTVERADGSPVETVLPDGDGPGSVSGNYVGYVNVTGPFNNSGVSSATSNVLQTEDPSDGEIEWIHLSTNSTGQANFTATPDENATTSIEAALEHNVTFNATSETLNRTTDRVGGLENVRDAAVSLDSPDLVGSDTDALSGADVVNIIDYTVEDPQTDNQATPFAAGGFTGSYTQVYPAPGDEGPQLIEVLPLSQQASPPTNNSDRRLQSLTRVGNDTFRDLDGMTVYNVTFELRNRTNNPIEPAAVGSPANGGNLTEIRVTGPTIDAEITSDGTATGNLAVENLGENDNVIDAAFAGPDRYSILVRPTAVSEPDATLDLSVTVADPLDAGGEETVDADSVRTRGLQVTRFDADNETDIDVVPPQSTINLTAAVETDDSQFVNNGRVRVSQEVDDPTGGAGVTTLEDRGDVDGRTAAENINDGEYVFDGADALDVGPRGIDTTGNGIGDEISQLFFTAYQYDDVDDDGQVDLEEDEVTRATVEDVELELTESLEVEYLPNETDEYSGFENGTFTLTRGVEYDQIAFRLTDGRTGEPVNLTRGLGGTYVPLSTLESFDGDADGVPDLAVLTTANATGSGTVPVRVTFNATASDPANGTYVIADLQQVGPVVTNNRSGVVSQNPPALNNNDVFAIASTPPLNNELDEGVRTFDLDIETPNRSRTTAPDAGQFDVDDPVVETEIVGVAGDVDPDVNATYFATSSNNGLTHTSIDSFALPDGVSVGDIETGTADSDRSYRVNATVFSALGQPLNATNNRGTYLRLSDRIEDDDSSGDGFPNDATGDNVDVAYDFVIGAGVQNATGTLGNAGATTPRDSDAANITADATVQFDITVDSLGDALEYDPSVQVHKGTVSALAVANVTAGPEFGRERVNVYGRNGGELPRSDDDGDLLLAKDVQNQLRLEAFPNDPDDFVLPNRTQFALTGSFSEDNITPRTQLNSTLGINLVTQVNGEGFESGQAAIFSVTPTSTGPEIIQLQSGGVIVRNVTGSQIVFDVLDSNREFNINVSATQVGAGDDLTVTLTAEATGSPLENTRVDLNNPSGDIVDNGITDSTGEVTLTVPPGASPGTFTVSATPAGFEPNSTEVQVQGEAQLEVIAASLSAPAQATQGNTITVEATVENTGSETGTDTVTFRLDADQNGSFTDAADVELTESVTLGTGQTQQVSFDVPVRGLTVSAVAGNYTHGVFTSENNATAELEVLSGSSVTFDDKTVQNGTTEITVESATLPDGGWVVIHVVNESQGVPAGIGAPVGNSSVVSAGTVTNATVRLDSNAPGASTELTAVTENQTLVGMTHRDDPADGVYAFMGASAGIDLPYFTDAGGPVIDSARITVGADGGDGGPGVLPGQSDPAQDLDDDGLFEDINGDDQFNIVDVSVFLGIFDQVDAEDEQFVNFDEDEDGEINIVDVSVLLGQT